MSVVALTLIANFRDRLSNTSQKIDMQWTPDFGQSILAWPLSSHDSARFGQPLLWRWLTDNVTLISMVTIRSLCCGATRTAYGVKCEFGRISFPSIVRTPKPAEVYRILVNAVKGAIINQSIHLFDERIKNNHWHRHKNINWKCVRGKA